MFVSGAFPSFFGIRRSSSSSPTQRRYQPRPSYDEGLSPISVWACEASEFIIRLLVFRFPNSGGLCFVDLCRQGRHQPRNITGLATLSRPSSNPSTIRRTYRCARQEPQTSGSIPPHRPSTFGRSGRGRRLSFGIVGAWAYGRQGLSEYFSQGRTEAIQSGRGRSESEKSRGTDHASTKRLKNPHICQTVPLPRGRGNTPLSESAQWTPFVSYSFGGVRLLIRS